MSFEARAKNSKCLCCALSFLPKGDERRDSTEFAACNLGSQYARVYLQNHSVSFIFNLRVLG